jgi:hypothetical protein
MIVLVIGMHRSGTSAVAGLLHSNGIFMGEDRNFIPRPAPENPKGFYENVRFRHVNDLILSQNNYAVKTFSPQVPDRINLSNQAKDIMMQLIYEYNKKYPVWGFKDPRLCLTYSAWKQIFEELKIKPQKILCYRKFDDIAKSMKIRNPGYSTQKKYKALANAYYTMLLKDLKKPTIIIRFNSLIDKTEKIAKYISISFIDPKLGNRGKK